MNQQMWKIQQWLQDWKKVSFHSSPKKGKAKERSNYHTIALISLARKVMEKAMAAHSSTLAWKIPWTEGPGGLQSMGSLGVGHD